MSPSEVQVWSASPNVFSSDECDMLALLLDGSERSRCAQLRSEVDRRAYVVSHALQRLLLADALGVRAAQIRFAITAHGKPVLDWPREDGLSFSLSNTRELACAVLARGSEVGVDAEPVDSQADFALLERFMLVKDAVQRELDLSGTEEQQFFFYWTALEAFWKALGVGLSPANPRLRLRKTSGSHFEAAFEHDPGGTVRAQLMRLPSQSRCAIAVAVVRSTTHQEAGDVHRPYGCGSWMKKTSFKV